MHLNCGCWRRLLRVPWTSRRSNQSILEEISLEYSLVGLMLKLKFSYFDHLLWRTDSLEKTLRLGKIEGRRRREQQGWDRCTASLTQWTWVWVNSGSWWCTGRPGVLQSMRQQRVRHNWVTELTEWMNDWLQYFYLKPSRPKRLRKKLWLSPNCLMLLEDLFQEGGCHHTIL